MKKTRRKDPVENLPPPVSKEAVTQKPNAPFIDPIYENKTTMERLRQIPCYSDELNSKKYADIIAMYYMLSLPRLESMLAEVKKRSILEFTIVRDLIKILKDKDENAFELKKYYDDRTFGKSKQAIEHSGPGGSPMSHITGNVMDLIDQLSDDELDKLEKVFGVEDLP